MFTFIAGGQQYRRWCGEVHRGQRIIGGTAGKLGKNIGSDGRNDQRFSLLRLPDMLNRGLVGGLVAVRVVPQVAAHFLTRERRESKWLHKAVAAW
jgi:hypothetical protein